MPVFAVTLQLGLASLMLDGRSILAPLSASNQHPVANNAAHEREDIRLRTRILTSVAPFMLAGFISACGGDELQTETTAAAALCHPNWVLDSNDNLICHVDKDRHFGFYDLEFYTDDSYVDANQCYSGLHFIKRKVDEITCLITTSESRCIRDSGWINLPPVDRNDCTGPRVNNTPVCGLDSDCDDGLFCTGQEICDQGVCRSINRPCFLGEERCIESTRSCVPIPCPGHCP